MTAVASFQNRLEPKIWDVDLMSTLGLGYNYVFSAFLQCSCKNVTHLAKMKTTTLTCTSAHSFTELDDHRIGGCGSPMPV
jgi:hypothetical protein